VSAEAGGSEIFGMTHSALASIKKRTTEIQFSMASGTLVGAMLRVLVASKPNGRFLELGTGTGIATAWLLRGMDAGSTLVSVDNDVRSNKWPKIRSERMGDSRW
jgi:predicted O-methyltransferase YrrM